MARQLVFRDLGGQTVTVTTAYMKSRRAVYAVFEVNEKKVKLWIYPDNAVELASALLEAVTEFIHEGQKTALGFIMPTKRADKAEVEIAFLSSDSGRDVYSIVVRHGKTAVEILASYEHVVRIANALLDAAVYGWEP